MTGLDHPLAAVPGVSTVDAIVRRLQEELRAGRLKAGDAIPAERRLAAGFGVSRNTVREALRRLAAQGVVEVRGRKTQVSDRSIEALVDIFSFRFNSDRPTFIDIQGFRALVETGLALDIAGRVTDADLQALSTLNEHVRGVGEPLMLAEADYAFHLRIVEISGNRTALQIYSILQGPIQQIMTLGKISNGGELAYASHLELIALLRQRDVRLFEAALRLHLNMGLRHIGQMPQPAATQPMGAA